METRFTPTSLIAIVLAAGGCGIPLDGYTTLPCAANGYDPAVLSGFTLDEPADYLELRSGDTGEYTTEDSVGTPCATATDVDACEAALAAATAAEGFQLGQCVDLCTDHLLLVNRGDTVEVVNDADAVAALMGTVDTEEEAAASALLAQYGMGCDEVGDGGVREADDGYEVIATRYTSTCSPLTRSRYQLGVTPNGTVSELAEQQIVYEAGTCIGRRPDGLECAPTPADTLGDWLAEITRLEAAAVYAFSDLRMALMAHGAPQDLVDRAAEARADELRHTRDMGRLARRHGARLRAPEVSALPTPSLEALATANAVEGCVRETFGALVGLWQAGAAEDPTIRATMAAIGPDEARHAALSWAIAAWAEPQLDAAARARVEAARAAALAQLRAEITAPVPEPLRRSAGMPTPDAQARLLDGLAAKIAA